MKSKANWLKEGDSVLSSFSMNRIPLVHAVIAFILFILFIYFLEQMVLYKEGLFCYNAMPYRNAYKYKSYRWYSRHIENKGIGTILVTEDTN